MKKLFTLPVIVTLFALNIFVWHTVSTNNRTARASLHILDVGQGDSELLLLPHNVAIVTDAGPDSTVAHSIARILPPTQHYIDIGIITHPQRDHYGGFKTLVDRYSFGAIVTNGREADNASREWKSLLEKIREKNILQIALQRGDRIRYESNSIEFLSPTPALRGSKELNDTGLVERVQTPDFSALLTADIGKKVEQLLLNNRDPIAADILKVGHHGSKFSSTKEFLDAVAPRAAAIGVGKNNTYRHPAAETLGRLEELSIRNVLRTDQHGTISIIPENGKLKIYTER